MKLEIALDPVEDRIALIKLAEYCERKEIFFSVTKLVVKNIETKLSMITIGVEDDGIYIQRNLPKFPVYRQLITEDSRDFDKTAVLVFLGKFYGVPVKATNFGLDTEFFFEDNITPFYVKEDSEVELEKTLNSLYKRNLVSDDPMFKLVLKAYPNQNVVKMADYDIWTSDKRTNTERTSRKMEELIKQGYFYPQNSKVSRQVFEAYEFVQLGTDCVCDFHFNDARCTCAYSKTLDYDDFFNVPIKGKKIGNTQLGKEFFDNCVDYIGFGEVPSVSIELDFYTDRRTKVAAISGYINTFCGDGHLCDEVKCGRVTACTYLSCKILDDITVENDYITFKCGNFDSISKVINFVRNNTQRVTIVPVRDIEDGINVRLSYYDNTSVLVDDYDGMFVGIWDLDPTTEVEEIELNYTEEYLEQLASSMDNYQHFGKDYAYTGFYQISNNNEMILGGLLRYIPYTEPIEIDISILTFRTEGNKCKIYLKESMLLLLTVEAKGRSKNDMGFFIADVVDRFAVGEFFDDWGLNLLSQMDDKEAYKLDILSEMETI
jgi:hypothetical protein